MRDRSVQLGKTPAWNLKPPFEREHNRGDLLLFAGCVLFFSFCRNRCVWGDIELIETPCSRECFRASGHLTGVGRLCTRQHVAQMSPPRVYAMGRVGEQHVIYAKRAPHWTKIESLPHDEIKHSLFSSSPLAGARCLSMSSMCVRKYLTFASGYGTASPFESEGSDDVKAHSKKRTLHHNHQAAPLPCLCVFKENCGLKSRLVSSPWTSVLVTGMNEVRIGVAYSFEGEHLQSMPSNLNVSSHRTTWL